VGPNGAAAAWNGATAYVLDDRVHYEHKIYQRIVAGTTGTAPDLDETNWDYVSPTNRWKMMDASNTTKTQKSLGSAGDFSFYVYMGPDDVPDVVVFDDVEAGAIVLTVYDSTVTTVLHTASVTLRDLTDTWRAKKSAVFQGLPSASEMVFAITVYAYDAGFTPSHSPKVGTLVFGNARVLGAAVAGFSAGINDRSLLEEDDYGNINVVERSYSKRMAGTVMVQSEDVDAIVNLLASYRATPAMYLAVGGLYASMVMYGIARTFEASVQTARASYLSIDIKGLV
jgi:hypothetical protein